MHFWIPDGVLAADILRRHQSIHDAFYFLRASQSSEKQNQSKEITEEIAKESRHGTLRLDRHRHRSDITILEIEKSPPVALVHLLT